MVDMICHKVYELLMSILNHIILYYSQNYSTYIKANQDHAEENKKFLYIMEISSRKKQIMHNVISPKILRTRRIQRYTHARRVADPWADGAYAG